MQKLTIDFSQSRCVGARKCIQVAPRFFSWDGEKATLQGADTVYGIQKIVLGCNPAQVKRFIEAASSCPVNAIKITEGEHTLVGTEIHTGRAQEIVAEYDDTKEFQLDPAGYFLIRTDKNAQTIEVGFCNERNTVLLKVVGEKPIDIYHTILHKEFPKLDLTLHPEHCAYLGRELQKAYMALKLKKEYVQDDELDL